MDWATFVGNLDLPLNISVLCGIVALYVKQNAMLRQLEKLNGHLFNHLTGKDGKHQ